MCVIKHPYTELFIAALYSAVRDIIMPRHELAIASNISNTIHCMYTVKSNVKLHELDVYSQHTV